MGSRKMAVWSICLLLFLTLECQCMVCPDTESEHEQATSKSFNSVLKQMKKQLRSYKKDLRPLEIHQKTVKVRQDDFKDVACSFDVLAESIQSTLPAINKLSRDKQTHSKSHKSILKQLSGSTCDAFRIYRNLTGANVCRNANKTTEPSDVASLVTREFNTLCKLEFFVSCLLSSSDSEEFFKSKKLVCKRASRKCRKGKKGRKSRKRKGKKGRKHKRCKSGKKDRKGKKTRKCRGHKSKNKKKTNKENKKGNEGKTKRKGDKNNKKNNKNQNTGKNKANAEKGMNKANAEKGKSKANADKGKNKANKDEDKARTNRDRHRRKKKNEQGEQLNKHQTNKYKPQNNGKNDEIDILKDICMM